MSIILILAISLRFAYMTDYRNSNIYPVLEYSDSYSYFIWAKDISSGDLLGRGAFMKWPLYAYFLGFLFKFSKDNIAFVYLLQYILGAVNCVLVYFIGRKIFNEKSGFIAGLLCAWYGLFIFYDSLLVYTCLSLFLNSLLFLFILNIKDKPSKKKLFWAGVFSGICTITQANIVIFGILAILWVLRKNRLSWAKLLYDFSFFIFGLAIIIGGVALKNYLAEKDFVLIAGNAGFNFYSGNNPDASGTFFCPVNIGLNQEDMFRDSKVIANNKMGRNLNAREVSGFWFNKAIGFIREEPVKYLKLLLRKIAFVFSPKEFIHDIEYHFIAGKVRILKIMFMDLKLILPPALLGIFLGLRKFKESAPLYIALIALPVSISLFFVTARYRIVIVPYLMIFAGFGIFNLWEMLKNGKVFKFILLCAVLIAVSLLLNNLAMHLEKKASKNNAIVFDYHFMKAMDYKNSSDYQSAIRELELAHKVQPDNQGTVLQAGAIYFRLNDFRAAEGKFRAALKISPLSVDAYYNLGLIYNKQKRFTEARDMLKQALLLDPENVGAHFELGVSCKSLGDTGCARKEFGIALEKINRWRIQERAIIERELIALGK